MDGWREELEAAIRRARDHLSLYQLTIEYGTMFERLRDAGKLVLPGNDLARALWDVTQEITTKAGLPAYEISNHARPGGESLHNLIYWRYGEYIGIGPGAHGRILSAKGRRAHATESYPETWLTAVENAGHALVEDEILSSEEQSDEFLLMGLRLSEGIEPAEFEAISGAILIPAASPRSSPMAWSNTRRAAASGSARKGFRCSTRSSRILPRKGKGDTQAAEKCGWTSVGGPSLPQPWH